MIFVIKRIIEKAIRQHEAKLTDLLINMLVSDAIPELGPELITF